MFLALLILKNFPTKFPATSYLKGENRGFSIINAEVISGGLRVGEKQSLVHIEEDDCYAVRLEKQDWVKYGLDISESSTYSIAARITTASAGAKIKITIYVIHNNTIALYFKKFIISPLNALYYIKTIINRIHILLNRFIDEVIIIFQK